MHATTQNTEHLHVSDVHYLVACAPSSILQLARVHSPQRLTANACIEVRLSDCACLSPLLVLIVRRCVVQVLLPSLGQSSASVYFIESLHRAQKHITMEQCTRSALFQAIQPAGRILTLATHG